MSKYSKTVWRQRVQKIKSVKKIPYARLFDHIHAYYMLKYEACQAAQHLDLQTVLKK